jgi:hypothetical protein
MLSYPLEEVRIVAQAMHEEALKLSPGLLKHVGENEYEKVRREKVSKEIDALFPKPDDFLYQGIANEKKYKIICYENLDDHILASILFEE